MLIDVTSIDTRVDLFGRGYDYPILLAPAGYHKLVHPDGEIETVKGANLAETTLVAAAFSTVTFGDMSAVAKRPLWFQIYVQSDRGFTKSLVDQAIAAGCEAICVTVDVPINGPRDRELRAGFNLPQGVERANLAGLGSAISAAAHRPVGRNIYSATHGADVTWKDIDWLRKNVPVKLLLKGILHQEDAELALRAGCDGVIVSNHGGRSLDTVPAAIDALPAIANRIERPCTYPARRRYSSRHRCFQSARVRRDCRDDRPPISLRIVGWRRARRLPRHGNFADGAGNDNGPRRLHEARRYFDTLPHP